jgi:formiminoglutamate deiminase
MQSSCIYNIEEDGTCPVRSELFFRHALLPGGWAANLLVGIEGGFITALTPNAEPVGESHAIGIPGMPNLHSHSFQRAFAGLTETRGATTDSFWSWREQMYRFALRMSPDDIEAVATLAFIEMLEGGFCSVAEFHYLHHDMDGGHYADIAETSARIAAASATAGIDLTLLPVFYAHSGFGGVAPVAGQRRFISGLDDFQALYARCQAITASLPGGRAGIAPHSLRAVTPHELNRLLTLADGAPFHLHIAEQTKEVADCLAWSGARPIEWLLSHAPVAPNWCLIHATHAGVAERDGMAKAGAVIGLCPITEANLGDGIFHTQSFPGNIGIGSDSNVLIDTAQELRQLEYSQRLMAQSRNVLASDAAPATATALYQRAVAGGAKALGVAVAGLAIGAPANIVTLNKAALGPAAEKPDTALNVAVFAARAPAVESVWVRGRKLVVGGRHVAAQAGRNRFNAVIAKLM